MLKLIGVILVAGGCTLWGVWSAQELSRGVRLMEEIVLAVQVLERQLALFRPEMSTLLMRMAQGRNEPVFSMLTACSMKVEKGNDFTETWNKELEELPLSGRECGLLRGLGQVLGSYDAAGQAQAAASIRGELEACVVQRRQESQVKGRIYQTLGATVGGFLVLTLL